MSECEIRSVVSGSLRPAPKLVTFQNGKLQSQNDLQLQCDMFSDEENNKTIITVATDRLLYKGEEKSNDLFCTLLAIRDKKSNKIRVVPVNPVSLNVQFYNANPQIENNDTTVKDLYKKFGSKKTQRQTEQLEKMKMDVSNIEEELKQNVADIKIDEKDLTIPSISDSNLEYQPKMNKNATNVDEVFNLNSFISRNELNSLKNLATEVRDKHTINEQLTPFVLDCVNNLKEKNVQDVEKYEILLYIDAILKFFKIPLSGGLKKKYTIEPYPNIIINKIVNDYTIIYFTKRNRPLIFRDKAVCNIIALGLMVFDYKLKITNLATSLNGGLKKFTTLARSMGLTIAPGDLISLELPLLPPIKKIFRKKKTK